MFDAYWRGHAEHPEFVRIRRTDLRTGQHRNPSSNPDWFTTAYLHTPDELTGELQHATLTDIEVLPVEGPMHWPQTWPSSWQTRRGWQTCWPPSTCSRQTQPSKPQQRTSSHPAASQQPEPADSAWPSWTRLAGNRRHAERPLNALNPCRSGRST